MCGIGPYNVAIIKFVVDVQNWST